MGGSSQIFAAIVFLLMVGYVFFGEEIMQYFNNEKDSLSGTELNVNTEQELDTKLSPARDLTGTWEGPAKWTNNVANPACNYEGKIKIVLDQQGSDITGTYTTTITKSDQLLNDIPCSEPGEQGTYFLRGEVSSSTLEFTVTNIVFSGSFTTDLMTGTFESCPNQRCLDGTNSVGFKGDFSLMRK